MGKVITRVLPADDPIFTGGWSIATVKRPFKNNKNSSKKKVVVKDDRYVLGFSPIKQPKTTSKKK